jgi:uncharacterized protein YdiU (UPF0061 family)
MPLSPSYRPALHHQTLGDDFFDRVTAAPFPQTILRFRNDRHAARIGLDQLNEAEWISHFGRFIPLPDTLQTPLALRYHGHQFGHYNPDLGDGRGFLFAQLYETGTNRLLDLGTKGSGQTPWSRQGDGRLTLKGGMREVLASEMLEALGVNTSKTFSLIETGESLVRSDEPSPTRSSVMVRLSHSHIRIGTFQRLATHGDEAGLRLLVDYVIKHYWPEAAHHGDPLIGLFNQVITAVARMGAQWFAAGFVHGVLNTDNITLTGESFDYGPWRFLPHYDPRFTAAYFDQTGLYSFGRQPEALLWNLARLAETFLPLTEMDGLRAALQTFLPQFKQALTSQTLRMLGLAPEVTPQSHAVITQLYSTLRDTRAPFAQSFFDLYAAGEPEKLNQSPIAGLYAQPVWQEMIAALRSLPVSSLAKGQAKHPYRARREPVTMLIETVEALWQDIDRRDDWSAFTQYVQDIRMMGSFYAPHWQD